MKTLVISAFLIAGSFALQAQDASLLAVTSSTPIKDEVTEVHCFPNPAKNHIEISFFLLQEDAVAISITNKQGTIVRQMKPLELAAGGQIIRLRTEDLQPGDYLVQVSAGADTKTVRFSKQ